jgi:glycine betaine/proline transport system substrate-binding protein
MNYSTLLKATVTAALLATSSVATAADSKDPIKLTIHDWTGQHVTTHIMGEVLKKAGNNIEYVQADYIAQFAGLQTGDLHVAMEMWETTGKEAMDASLNTGKTVDLGETGMDAKEEWWYPSYMKEKCPGLPDWKALNKCAEAFSTPETAPKGRYVGGPVTWAGFDDERVEALGLDFEVIHAGTEAAMFAELESAYQRKAPVLLWVYAPHWAVAKFDGEWVEFPEYTPECYSDPKWGTNPNMAYDCGKPFGWIKKVGWKDGEKKWPNAYKAVRNFNIDNKEMGAMISAIDLDGKKLDDVVADWMNKNESRWKAWIK